MKRILIIALASIFLVNMLALIPNAKTIYSNGTIENYDVNIGNSGSARKYITGNYITEENNKYEITMKIPKIDNEVPKFNILIGSSKLLIEIENNEIQYTNENVESAMINNDTVVFTIKNTVLYGESAVTKLNYRIFGTIGQSYKLTLNDPILTIDDLKETTPGDILIDNVSNAPKDVLREVVAVLPVLIAILIAYIATRKGIAFIRSILESA